VALTPIFDAFSTGFDAGQNQLVYTRLAADLDTPVSLMLKLSEARKDSFILESVTGGEVRGRYSIIGAKPDLIWQCHGEVSRINRAARIDRDTYQDQSGAPLDNLRALIAESRIDMPDDLPPASAGLFGYLGYDMIRLVEHLPDVNPDPLGLPDAIMMRPSVVVVLDGVKGEVIVVAPAWASSGLSAKAAYAQAAERVMDAVRDLERQTPDAARDLGDATEPAPQSCNFTHDGYKAAVEKAKDYIRAGDIFQVVLSQRFSAPFNTSPFELYRSLRRSNPSPFLFYLNFDDFSLVGSSPEILVRVRDGEITIRPIAGTRPRGATPSEDAALADDLLADPKEHSEHLMLLDLGRNDVARSAKTGSVRVTDSFQIERYSHVMHIVSNVVGELRNGVHPVDAVAAGFPAGTVSGAPKIRAMGIIDELENSGRGIYGGAIGYFSADGNVDTCIALRTAVVKDGTIHVQAGAGIVADSDPESEQRECENKAAALFSAATDAISRTRN